MSKSIKISDEVHTRIKEQCEDRKRSIQDCIECAVNLFCDFDIYTQSDLLAGRKGEHLKALIQKELKELLS